MISKGQNVSPQDDDDSDSRTAATDPSASSDSNESSPIQFHDTHVDSVEESPSAASTSHSSIFDTLDLGGTIGQLRLTQFESTMLEADLRKRLNEWTSDVLIDRTCLTPAKPMRVAQESTKAQEEIYSRMQRAVMPFDIDFMLNSIERSFEMLKVCEDICQLVPEKGALKPMAEESLLLFDNGQTLAYHVSRDVDFISTDILKSWRDLSLLAEKAREKSNQPRRTSDLPPEFDEKLQDRLFAVLRASQTEWEQKNGAKYKWLTKREVKDHFEEEMRLQRDRNEKNSAAANSSAEMFL